MSPGLPQMPGSQPPAPPPNLNSMMGSAGAPQPQQAMQSNAAGQGMMLQIRELTSGMDTLASQYPEIADKMQQAKRIVASALVQVVGSQPAPESQSPNQVG